MEQTKNIVILGAGYGGILTALGLEKKFGRDKNIAITVIDRRDYQLFASNLYEVATADEELVSQDQLKKSIAITLEEVFAGKKINFVKGEIQQIDQAKKTISVGIKTLFYDYLVVALGAQSDYFGIGGADKFSLPLKSLPDALRVRNQIEFAIGRHKMDASKPNIRVVVAGGGYSGVEFAAELSHEIKFLAWKNSYPPEKVEIVIIEATGQLIPGFSSRLSQDALWKLKNRGVRVQLSSPIFRVEEHFVELVTQEREEYDVLVWTTGVKAVNLPFAQPVTLDRKGRVVVNEFLQIQNLPEIFVVGDCASITNLDGKPAPPTAQDAIEQGKYLAYALPMLMQNQKPHSYKGQKHGFIVTLGGKWAILDYGGFYLSGMFAYFIRSLVSMHYYAQVVGWWNAIKYFVFDWEIYGRND